MDVTAPYCTALAGRRGDRSRSRDQRHFVGLLFASPAFPVLDVKTRPAGIGAGRAAAIGLRRGLVREGAKSLSVCLRPQKCICISLTTKTGLLFTLFSLPPSPFIA